MVVPPALAKFGRWLRNVSVPVSTFLSFCSMLLFLFILYQPTPGPGIIQRLGWQSWDLVSTGKNIDTTVSPISAPAEDIPEGVDWWNVTTDTQVDQASLPLDVWNPLMPHDTGFSEIAVTRCFVNPRFNTGLCAPDSTSEQDAIRGKWVRIDRNLNYDAGYFAGYLNLYYRRTRRQDINLVTDIQLLPESQSPPEPESWKKAATSLRSGVSGVSALYLWYKVGKTAANMSPEERANIITELDLSFGDDIPWYGFEKLEPPTLPRRGGYTQTTWLTMRRGVKPAPRAPPLHFSHDGRFKILQIADLHYSVAAGTCRETPASLDCSGGSDNLTTTSLISRVLAIEKPDLVVFTGDQLNGQGTSWDPKSVLAKFSRAVADQGIPWTAIFGNHDEETGYVAKVEQVKLMQALPYSLVEAGPKDIHGVGNYVLKVKSADASKTHLLTLYFLDSGSYSKGFYNFWGLFTPTAYDWIRQNQIDWFLQESASISPIQRPFTPDTDKDLGQSWKRQSSDQVTPQTSKLAKPNALMFFHMPLPETYDTADSGNSGRLLDFGISGQELRGDAKSSDGFFSKGILSALESDHVTNTVQEVKVIGNGHCHLTENCRRVKGVWFCFGGGGSYSGYGKLGFDRRFRIYDISDYGETIRTYKRTEQDGFQDNLVDDIVLVGKGAKT
ncbi:Metallo-dependent phosphatase-like protein [Roridomyces roridus]|uniref:Metallo-dependent phosphatase-like protein n=1 Tax=Roridomyces roridus TaxID=1738132 RepID=A0AAD7BK45_9AGAR|nr:Metallo-dependent phosphatase-like protein [Roridomyces roridus]